MKKMKKSSKIWIAIVGILFIVLGVVCIAKPVATLFATAWLLGLITLFAGVAKLIFTLDTQRFLPNSGTRMLSALFEIILGIFFLGGNLFVAASLPMVFAFWVIVEGIIAAVQSFDYKQAGYSYWWCMLLMGIGAAVLGFLGLRNPDVTAASLSLFIGIGVILMGIAHLVALGGINRFEKKIDNLRSAVNEAIGA